MKDRDFYCEAFSKVKASQDTIDRLEKGVMKRQNTKSWKRMAVAAACIAVVIAIPVAANAAMDGKLLEKVLVSVNGIQSDNVSVFVSPDGTEPAIGAEGLERGEVITYMDTDPKSPNYKKGGSLVVGNVPPEQSTAFLPVTGYVEDDRYMVVQVIGEDKPETDVTDQLMAGEVIEFTGSYKTLTYHYSVYMEDSRAVIKNMATGKVTGYFDKID